jgi:DUF4097 and DUF4098 domain-containing protein YvlB
MSGYTHHRGSIFWALTLIAIGVIFLWENFNPAIHPWHIIARYWPVLIIFWGLSKLFDYIHAQQHPETAPPSLFSGSEVVLLLLILALGTLVSKIVLRPGGPGWFNNEEVAGWFLNTYTFTDTFSEPVKPSPHLVIEDQRGSVAIEGTDQSKIDVVAKKTVRAEDEEAAKKVADQLKVELAEEAGHYILRSNRSSVATQNRRISIDLSLRVPHATATELTADRGDIILNGLKGDQTLSGLHGDVRANSIEGLLRIHKSGGYTEVRGVKGSLELDGRGDDVEVSSVSGTATVDGEFTGAVQFRDMGQMLRFHSSRTDLTAQKLSGRLYMEVGSLDVNGVNGPFDVTTRQKDITVSNFTHTIRIVDDNGNVRLRTAAAPTQSIDVQLKKGEIELDLPAGSNFQIQATSRKGEVQCNFTGPQLKVVKEGDNPSISGTVGSGGPMIRLSTEYGAIRILRGGAVPAPPAPPATPEPPAAPQRTTQQTPRHSHHGPAQVVSLEPGRGFDPLDGLDRFHVALLRDALAHAWISRELLCKPPEFFS